MSRRLFYLICVVFVLGLFSSVSAQDIDPNNRLITWWSGYGDGSSWDDPNNWWPVEVWDDEVNDVVVPVEKEPNMVPGPNEVVNIGQGNIWDPYPPELAANGVVGFPVIDSGTNAEVLQMWICDGPGDTNGPNRLDVTGGTLRIGLNAEEDNYDGLQIGTIAGGTGLLNISDGTVHMGPELDAGPLPWYETRMGVLTCGASAEVDVSHPEGGLGIITMTGGEFICYNSNIPSWEWEGGLAEGHLYMYGGTFTVTNGEDWGFWMDGPWNPPVYADPNSSVVLTDGKIITGDDDEGVWTSMFYQLGLWIDLGVIYAGGDPCTSELFLDVDITNDGKTTLQAFSPGPGQAYHPNPAPGYRVSLETPTLTWTPGDDADSHIVYFSSSFADVTDGTAPNTPRVVANYTAGTLDFDTIYYWRVDEVNISTVEGAVWGFKTDTHLNIDDMESYGLGINTIYDTWTQVATAAVNLELETDAAYDGNLMSLEYDNDTTGSPTKPRYAEIYVAISALEVGSDWTVAGATSVVLRFKGQETNYGEPIYFGVEDSSGAGSYAGVYYDSCDINAIQVEQWQEWNIDLEDLNSAGVDLTDIQTVYLGIGVRGNTTSTGEGTVYFDEIELWPPRCRPDVTFAEGDVSGDCYINNYDLEMIGRDWLLKSDWVSASEPVPGPVTHWRMDSNTSPTLNSGTLGTAFNGDLEYMDWNNWVSPGAPAPDNPEPNGAFYFSSVDDYVNAPDFNSAGGDFNSTFDSATLTAWVKRDGTQVNFAGILISTRLGAGWDDSVIQFGLSVGADWDDPDSTNKMKYHWEEDVGWAIPTELFIPDNTWTFCAVSVRPTNASVYMMPLGEAMQTTVVIQDHVVADMNQPIHIGQDPRDFEAHRRWKGWIDDVRIYDYALTDEEIVYASQGSAGQIWYELEPWRSDLFDDDAINFMDFAVLGNRWLDGPILWPESN